MKLWSVVIGVALVAASCAAQPSPGDDNAELNIVASFYPIAEAARRIGGPDVEVRNLTPPGVEPHDLELASDNLDAVIDADVVLFLGRGFQPALEEAVDRAQGEVVDLLEGEELIEGTDEHAEESGFDPHIWLDPGRWSKVVSKIASALSEADADAANDYQAGLSAYVAELEKLDDLFAGSLETCERRLLVTSHAAFGYLAERYGLDQEAISGISPEAEPDPQRLAELTDLVEKEGVTTIFAETLVSPKVAETLAREAGVTVRTLNPVEGLTERQIEDGEDYTSVMARNLEELKAALGCD